MRLLILILLIFLSGCENNNHGWQVPETCQVEIIKSSDFSKNDDRRIFYLALDCKDWSKYFNNVDEHGNIK